MIDLKQFKGIGEAEADAYYNYERLNEVYDYYDEKRMRAFIEHSTMDAYPEKFEGLDFDSPDIDEVFELIKEEASEIYVTLFDKDENPLTEAEGIEFIDGRNSDH